MSDATPAGSVADDPVAQELEDARRELLDLSLRNALLNFKTLKSRGARVLDERPVHVFRLLVRESRRFSFLPRPEKDDEADDSEADDASGASLPQPDEEDDGEPGDGPAARHVDTKLQTGYTSAQLQSRLLSTSRASQRSLEEQGVDVLYLALGMLRWYDAPASNTERRAPLVMVPVELERTDVQARFRLRYTGEEIEGNPSLRAKLKGDFGLQLPNFPERLRTSTWANTSTPSPTRSTVRSAGTSTVRPSSWASSRSGRF
jgi:hypothetical protein